MNFERRRSVSVLFVCLTLGSAVYLALATVNYLSFYPALQSLEAHVLTVSLSTTPLNQSKLTAQIVAENPSDYQGFQMADIVLGLSFYVANSKISLVAQRLPSDQGIHADLGPHSQLVFAVETPLNSQNATSLRAIVHDYPNMVVAHAVLTVFVITFLLPYTGYTYLNDIRDLALSSS